MEVEQTFRKDKFRGKLYSLTPDSDWKDDGTGFVAIQEGSDPAAGRRLVFLDETEGKVLHDRPVFGKEGTYQLQGQGERQTIIVWEDPESHQDYAISFAEVAGTLEFWQQLSTPPPQEEKRILPLPKMATLQPLSRRLMQCPPSERESVANECMHPTFVDGLRECFHTAEDLGSEEHLTQLWLIAKGIFVLSNQRLTERYLRHDIYEDVMGMLEYDDGLPREKRLPHRQVLQVQVNFKDVLSLENQEVIERIHLNYRLQYLKDIVLPRLLDDASFASLTQMIHSNLAQIIEHLQNNKPIIQRLFHQIRQKDLQSLAFLQDICRLAKILPPGERSALYDKFLQEKLFEVLVPFLSQTGEKAAINSRHAAVEVLLLASVHDASHLRNYLTSSRERAMKEFQDSSHQGRQLLGELIQIMITEADQGIQSQIAELLRAVMDPTTLEFRERDVALDVFYDDGALDDLVSPLREVTFPRRGPIRFAHQLICEILAFAVTHHGYRARVYIARHGIGQQACKLFSDEKNRSQQLAPIRLLKAMVASKDESYHRYITKHGLFAPLMRSFQESLAPPGLGGNLLVSATLELLETIRLENFKALVDHICKKHGQLLREHASKFKTLDMFFLRHQQNLEYEAFPPDQHSAGGPMARTSNTRPVVQRRSPGREDSDDDESYFESEDDEPVVDASDAGGAPGSQQGTQDGVPRDEGNSDMALTADGKGPAIQAEQKPGLKGLLGSYDDDDDEPSADAAVDQDQGNVLGQGEGAGTSAVAAGGDSSTAHSADKAEEIAAQAATTAPAEESSKLVADEATRSSEAAGPGATEDDSGAKAEAESRSLNHVVKRMKVNP
jgi:protein phosphatase-4 regulatory subunit 3